jgi:hypothetical protein
VSDRLARCREEGIDVLASVVLDALEAFDRAVTPESLRVLGREDGAPTFELTLRLISERSVDALDDRELITALWQAPDLLRLKWQPPGSARDRRSPGDHVRVVDSIRSSLEAAVAYALRNHVADQLDAVFGEARAA